MTAELELKLFALTGRLRWRHRLLLRLWLLLLLLNLRWAAARLSGYRFCARDLDVCLDNPLPLCRINDEIAVFALW